MTDSPGFFHTSLQSFVKTLRRFPWSISCALVITTCMLLIIHQHDLSGISYKELTRLMMPAFLGVPLFLMLATTRERLGKSLLQLPLEPAGLILLVIYYFSLPHISDNMPQHHFYRFALLAAAVHFAVAVMPFWARPGANGFWQFNRALFIRFFLASIYTAAFTIGLELALFSADKLFSLKLDNAYADLYFLIVGVFHPVFFLAGVPDMQHIDSETHYPKALKAFTQYVLAVLVCVYTIILYAYAVKILCTLQWPQGWVALPVLILATIGILASLLLHPLNNSDRWAQWFQRWFFPALAPLSILLLLSLRVRIAEYGFTEFRYLGLIAGIFVLVVSVVYCIRPQAGIRWIPTLLTIIALYITFGPFNLFSVSLNSRLANLQLQLDKLGLLKDHVAQPHRQTLDYNDYQHLKNDIQELVAMYGCTQLHALFINTKITDKSPYSLADELMNWLQLNPGEKTNSNYRNFSFDSNTALNIGGWGKCYYAPNGTYLYAKSSRSFGALTLHLQDGVLSAEIAGTKTEIPDTNSLITKIWNTPANQVSPDCLFIDIRTINNALPVYRVYFQNISVRQKDGHYFINNCSLIVLER